MEGKSTGIIFLAIALFCAGLLHGQEEDAAMVAGALIVVEREDPVAFLNAEGQALEEEIGIGSVLAPGNWAIAEKGGKLTLLLSNGTLVTLLSNTKMKVGDFSQVPFDAGDRKMSDLTGEPSSSQVGVDLDFGSLVVKTKKLDKKSSFDIHSPVGTAGIRGTEFQMGFDPGQGMQLDVTESTVAFTPPGGASATPVSQGSGLDFSGSGSVATRAVNPVVAQSIAQVTSSAVSASSNISLSAVTSAMSQTAAAGSDGGSDDSGGEEGDGEGDSDGGDDGSGGDDSGGGEDSSGGAGESSSAPAGDASSGSMIDSLLESDPDAKQTRESGKVSSNSKKLAGVPFSKSQLERFYQFSDSLQDELLEIGVEDAMRLLDTEGFYQSQAETFFEYSDDTQDLLLLLEDTPLVSLLESKIEEEFIEATLSAQSIGLGSSANMPADKSPSNLEEEVLALGDEMRASGTGEVFAEVEEMNGGNWSEAWLETARVGSQLAQDYSLSSDGENLAVLSSEQVLDNPFYSSVSTLYDQLIFDFMDVGMSPLVIGGSSLTVGAGSYDFTEMLGDKTALLIGATEQLNLSGAISLGGDTGLSAMLASGSAIEVSAGTSIKGALADLVISARQDVLLRETTLESSREVAIRSLRDLQLTQVKIHAPDRVHLRASRNLDINGLELSQSLPSLIMEATTIRLSNIDFPSTTAVQLNSLKGPIDGRYPNFGTSIPVSEQLGRVNFIENVRSGGNLMNNRPSFDQFGGNISIGKISNP